MDTPIAQRLSFSFLLLPVLFFLGSPAASGQISPELEKFLESRSFLDLIEDYKQEHISLRIPGAQAEMLAARPYTVGKGFRCQAFAGSQEENAQEIAAQLRALRLDSVYVIQAPAGLYKVQMGNFSERDEAEKLLDKLHAAGFTGAWVVETQIHIPRPLEETAAPPPATAETPLNEKITPPISEAPPPPGLHYAIQVFATSDSLKAFSLKQIFQKDYNQPVDVVQQNTIWKVLIGRFTERSDAKQFLKTLKHKGFQDAWITQNISS